MWLKAVRHPTMEAPRPPSRHGVAAWPAGRSPWLTAGVAGSQRGAALERSSPNGPKHHGALGRP